MAGPSLARLGAGGHAARFSLEGRRALITGAARGLGFAIARALGEAGATVLINGRQSDALSAAVQRLQLAGVAAEPAAFDITDHQASADWLAAAGGAIDVLINNVGQRDRRPTSAIDEADFAALLAINLTAGYGLCRTLAPRMAALGGGVIINIASIAGTLGQPIAPSYAAAKGGLIALTRSLAVELAPSGVRCNAIAPGFFMTETNAEMTRDAGIQRFVERRVPMQRWGEPDEIAGAAVFLASPAASYVNGQIIAIDGGLTAAF